MAMTYDPAVIHACVARLYARATNIVVSYTLLGLGIGLSAGYVIAGLLGKVAEGRMPYEALGILFFAGFGFSLGRSRADVLKLQAQSALCQVKIEENTRASSEVQRSVL